MSNTGTRGRRMDSGEYVVCCGRRIEGEIPTRRLWRRREHNTLTESGQKAGEGIAISTERVDEIEQSVDERVVMPLMGMTRDGQDSQRSELWPERDDGGEEQYQKAKTTATADSVRNTAHSQRRTARTHQPEHRCGTDGLRA